MLKRVLLGLTLLLVAVSVAQADIIVLFSSVTPSGGNFQWNYTVSITSGERLIAGNYFTIYDVQGLVAGSEVKPANWTVAEPLTGTTPPTIVPPDNPAVKNITFSYTGGTVIGQSTLGTFSYLSTFGIVNPQGVYTGESIINNPGQPNDGNFDRKIAEVSVPSQTPIPLPATAALFPIAGLGAGLYLLRSRRQ